MAEITPEQSNILDAISQAVRGTTSSFTQSSQKTYQPEGSTTDAQAMSAEERADRTRAQKASQTFKEATDFFNSTVNTSGKTQEQWKLQVEQNGKFLSDAVNAVTQQSNLGVSAFKDLESTYKLQDQLDVLQSIRDSFADGKVVQDDEWDAIHARLKKFKISLKDVGIRTEKLEPTWERVGNQLIKIEHTGASLTKNQGKLNDQVTETSKKLKNASDKLDGMAKSAQAAKEATGVALGAIAATAKFTIDETRIAMRRGVGDARDGMLDTAAMVVKLGVSTSKYMEVMADSRRVQLAMSSAGKSWKDQLIDTTNELQMGGLVGSAEEGLVAAAAFMKNTAMMGVAQKDLGDAVTNQTQIYKNNFRALAISTDQFNALTEDMLADVDIRKDLAKLQGTERRLYVESLQKRTAENMMMGFSIDRAKELNKHFAKISDQDPLERISQAAKMRAGLGAMGMGAEGARMQELLVKLPTLDAKERIKAQKEMTVILAKAQTRGQELMSQSVQANVAFGKILRNLNIKDTLQEFQTDTREGMRIAQQNQSGADAARQLAEEQNTKEVNKAFMLSVRAADSYQAALTSSTTAAVTIGASYIAGGGLKKGMGAIEGLLGTIAAGVTVAGVATAGAVVVGAGAAAYGISEIMDNNKDKETREVNKSDDRKSEDIDRQIEVQKQMLEVQRQQKASTDNVNKTLQQGNADRVAGNVSTDRAATTKDISTRHQNQAAVQVTGGSS